MAKGNEHDTNTCSANIKTYILYRLFQVRQRERYIRMKNTCQKIKNSLVRKLEVKSVLSFKLFKWNKKSSSISYNLRGLNWLFAAQLGSGCSEFQFKMIKDSSKVTQTRHESYYASWSVYIIIIITLCYAENSKLFPHHGESLHHIDSMQQKMINVLHVLLI